MTPETFTPVASLAGGLMIGASAAILLIAVGRVAGISGILAGTISPVKGEDGSWRGFFLGGLVLGGFVLATFMPERLGPPVVGSMARAVVAAVLVGVGVEVGGGCTSGHGVCGIGRFSPRSIVATITFMATAMLTVIAAHRYWSAP